MSVLGLRVPPYPWGCPCLPLAFDAWQFQTGLAGWVATPQPCLPPHALPAGLGTACPLLGTADYPAAQVGQEWGAMSRAGEQGMAPGMWATKAPSRPASFGAGQRGAGASSRCTQVGAGWAM